MAYILIYTVEQDADDMMASLNTLAAFPAEAVTITLDDVQKHTTEDKWWFSKDGCIDNGGVGKAQITTDIADALTAGDCTEQDLTMQQLYDDGWLPIVEGD